MTDYRIIFHNGIMWAKVNGEIDRGRRSTWVTESLFQAKY